MDELERMRAELLNLKDENGRLKQELAGTKSGQQLREKARTVSMRRKEERLNSLHAKISQIIREDETISTKELIQRL